MTQTTLHTHTSLNSLFIGAALTLGGASAFAGEEPIKESEFPITRRAVCHFNKIPISTPAEYQACEKFVAERRLKLTDAEKQVAQDAACFDRHKIHHISYYHSCRADFDKIYKTDFAGKPELIQPLPAPSAAFSLVPSNPELSENKSTALEACAKGAAVGLGTKILVHGVAALADIFGCAGLCTAAATSYTITATGVVIVGCAGGIVNDVIEGNKSNDKRPVLTPKAVPK